MRPEDQENSRYAKEDFCEIQMEEKLMFSLLGKYVQSKNSSPTSIHVLDIGCGSGRIGEILLKKDFRVSGVDFSEEAVKKALGRGVHAKQANLDSGIPESKNTFDIVWAGDIIEHVFDPISLIKEAHRVLKPNGAIVLSIPSDVGIVSRVRMLFGISYQEQMYRRSGFYKHHTFFNLRLIRFMLEQAGFQIKTVEKILIAPNKKRYRMNGFPSALYNELVILAELNR